jgi:hypothetical protein
MTATLPSPSKPVAPRSSLPAAWGSRCLTAARGQVAVGGRLMAMPVYPLVQTLKADMRATGEAMIMPCRDRPNGVTAVRRPFRPITVYSPAATVSGARPVLPHSRRWTRPGGFRRHSSLVGFAAIGRYIISYFFFETASEATRAVLVSDKFDAYRFRCFWPNRPRQRRRSDSLGVDAAFSASLLGLSDATDPDPFYRFKARAAPTSV